MTPEYNVEKKSKAEQKQGKLKKGASDHANLSLSPFWSGVTYFKLMAGPVLKWKSQRRVDWPEWGRGDSEG